VIAFGFICLVQKTIGSRNTIWNHEKFFDPSKRLNLKTLSELAKKTTIKSSQNKSIEYRQLSNIAFQLLGGGTSFTSLVEK
jgi:hypothetical protein